MKLSISNIAWSTENDISMYELLLAKHIDGLEIAPTRIFPKNPYAKIQDAKKYADFIKANYQLAISSLQSIWYGRQENIFSSLNEINELFQYTKQAIDFASAIKCKNLVFGCPRNRNINSPNNIQMLENVHTFLIDIGNYAYEHNTFFSIEPNPVIYNTNFINTTNEAIKLVTKLDCPGLKINLDIGTIIYNDENIDALDFSYINHIHISEPELKKIKTRDIHKEILSLAKSQNYSGYVSIEMGLSDLYTIEKTLDYLLELNEKV